MKHGPRSIRWLEFMLAISVVSLVLQLGWASILSWLNRPRAGVQVAQQFKGMDYWLYLPQAHGQSDESWPLLLFLHGAGERGTDLEIVKRGGPPAMIERGEDPAMIVISPQCPLNQTWDPTRLLALLDHLEQQFAVGHVVVTGYSMGGYGTWNLAQVAPQRFTAIAPLCGGGDAGQAEVLKNLPIWAFHGEKDKVVPLSQSQAMVDSVSAAGGDAKLTVYADEGHGICRLTYANPELFQWFLSHCRSADDAGTTMVHRQGKRSCDPSELVSL